MIIPYGILHKVFAWIFDLLKNMTAVTKNRIYGSDQRFSHTCISKTVYFRVEVFSMMKISVVNLCGNLLTLVEVMALFSFF